MMQKKELWNPSNHLGSFAKVLCTETLLKIRLTIRLACLQNIALHPLIWETFLSRNKVTLILWFLVFCILNLTNHSVKEPGSHQDRRGNILFFQEGEERRGRDKWIKGILLLFISYAKFISKWELIGATAESNSPSLVNNENYKCNFIISYLNFILLL